MKCNSKLVWVPKDFLNKIVTLAFILRKHTINMVTYIW